MAVIVRPIDPFYHKGNPTYNLFPKTEFDSIEEAIILQPGSDIRMKGVVFKKGDEAIGHLTINNLDYVFLVDEGGSRVDKTGITGDICGLVSHHGFIESRERPGHNPNDSRRMRDVFLHKTTSQHFVFDLIDLEDDGRPLEDDE